MRPVLVLGASGFVGRAVCRALAATPPAIPWVGVSLRTPASTVPTAATAVTGTADAAAGRRWVHCDLAAATAADFAALVDEVGPMAIVNCAGRSSGSATMLRSANVDLVRTLLAVVATRTDVRLIHVGSAAEYGPQPTDGPVAETAVPHPCGDYARSKLVATELVVAALGHGSAQGAVLRLFNPVGAGSPADSLPGRAARAIRDACVRRRSTVALGDLGTRRDFVAAADVGTAVVLALRAGTLPPMLNVGRGVATSAAALVALIEAAAGYDGEVVEADGSLGRSPAITSQRADVTALRRSLHWVPTTSLASAVDDLWADLVDGPIPDGVAGDTWCRRAAAR